MLKIFPNLNVESEDNENINVNIVNTAVIRRIYEIEG